MKLYDKPLFDLEKADIEVMGQYKLHESKEQVIVMSSGLEYDCWIDLAVRTVQVAILKAAILSYMI